MRDIRRRLAGTVWTWLLLPPVVLGVTVGTLAPPMPGWGYALVFKAGMLVGFIGWLRYKERREYEEMDAWMKR